VLYRRSFLRATAGAVLTPMLTRANLPEEVPEKLDHILLGCSDLDTGIAFVEEHTGVRASRGGAHPGRGTQNALLSLGERHYLEILAPDPAQPDSHNPRRSQLEKLREPRLVEWAAHTGNLELFAQKLHKAGVRFAGPNPGSRERPDGRLLQWQTLVLEDDESGLLPFFIEWRGDSLHPAVDSPAGCRLTRFALATPEPGKLAKTLALLSLEVPVRQAQKPQLRATFTGPKGNLDLTS
jgi:catechol 2,3-dioxygenase-like lactoylglutathione lyase family enzyme